MTNIYLHVALVVLKYITHKCTPYCTKYEHSVFNKRNQMPLVSILYVSNDVYTTQI